MTSSNLKKVLNGEGLRCQLRLSNQRFLWLLRWSETGSYKFYQDGDIPPAFQRLNAQQDAIIHSLKSVRGVAETNEMILMGDG